MPKHTAEGRFAALASEFFTSIGPFPDKQRRSRPAVVR